MATSGAEPAPIGETVLDECLAMIRDSSKPKSAETWVGKFANLQELKHKTAASLCEMGILRADTGKVLLIFSWKIYPEINPEPERALIERLREAIFVESEDVGPRTTVRLTLAHHAGLLSVVFNKKDLKAKRKRIREIVEGNLVRDATKSAIAAVQAAVFVAAVRPAVVVSSAGY